MSMHRLCYRKVTATGVTLAAAIASASLVYSPSASATSSVTYAQSSAASGASASAKSSTKTSASSSVVPSKDASKASNPSEKPSTSPSAKPSEKPSEPSTPTKTATPAPLENYSGGPVSKWGEGVEERMAIATENAKKEGATLGMAILDRQTGEFVCNAECDHSFVLASLSKVFIAETVGYTNYTPSKNGEIVAGTGEMPVEGNADAMARDDMMRYSNNEYTLQLWNRYGATNIIASAKERYGLSDATIADPDWGSTKSSPADLVRFLDGVISGKGGMSEEETEYLISLMYSLPKYSYGNADQDFGIRAGLPGETVGQKGGWYDPETRTSAGFFGDDERYVMAVLASNGKVDTLTEAVHTVFPEGVVRPGESTTRTNKTAATTDQAVLDRYSPMWLIITAAAGFGLGWLVRKKTQ